MMNCPVATDTDSLDKYLDTVDYLPPTPTLMIKLIDLFQQPDRDVDEIVSLMQQDPALTAEVMRRCNRSFFGGEHPVMDVNEAIFRLGFYEIYRLAVTLFGLKAVSLAKVVARLEVEILWRHSAITAITAGTIARELGEAEGVAFTAGLLHDVGKIVLASAGGLVYAELLEQHGHFGRELCEAENVEFGFDHGDIGARLLVRWGVPDSVSMPVLNHHQMSWSGEFGRLAAIVNLANLMGHYIQENIPGKFKGLPEASHAMDLLGIKPEDLLAIKQLARSDIKRLSSMLTF
jgi:putative nucleotidyltransferase with HDIG domain